MGKSTKPGVDQYRILLYRNNATELLFETVPRGIRLPTLAIPPGRVAEQLTTAIKHGWELEAYCLFSVSSGPSHRYAVLEGSGSSAIDPVGMRWMSLASLSTVSFQDSNDCALIAASQKTLDRYRTGELQGPFGHPGWLPRATEWVAEQASAAGLRLTGQYLQLNAGLSYSLIRFETNGAAVWFKAVGDDAHEHRVTLKLASAFPEFLPRLLASHQEWHAWLALECAGSPLDDGSFATGWTAAVESLARLQIQSLGRRFELIEAGSKDLRPSTLGNDVHPFFDGMAQLMEQQEKSSPPPLSRHDLLNLGRDITSALEELERDGVPNALGHLDLNRHNLFVSGRNCIFIDWAEAYVGPPFVSFEYLLESYRLSHPGDLSGEGSLIINYTKHWAPYASDQQIAASLLLAPLLAVFTYAAGGFAWRNLGDIELRTAGFLRSLARRMKREADILRERRAVCVP
jgi:hypothetical protein